jgi:ankyrin repeat protein
MAAPLEPIAEIARRLSDLQRGHGDQNELKQLVNAQELLFGRTELMKAVRGGRLPDISLLFDAGADPELCDNAGWTALHFAVWVDSLSFETRAEILRLLVKAGADPTRETRSGDSPLMLARERADASIVALVAELASPPVKAARKT